MFPPLARLWFDHRNGGDGWRQGDWLINFNSGVVRRGLIGEGLLGFSDVTNLPLLSVVIGFQMLLLAGFVWILWQIWRWHSERRLVVLLAASPAFCLFVWAGDLQGIMRKEILGYLAVGCLALASIVPRPTNALPLMALIFFAIACIGNVMHAALSPIMLIGFYFLYKQGRMAWRTSMVFGVGCVIVAIVWVSFAFKFTEIPDLDGVCTPLILRGLSPEFCDHAIRWLVENEVDHRAQVRSRMIPSEMLKFAVVTSFGIVSLWLAARHVENRRFVWQIAVLAYLPLLPLYAQATDWGRWMSISYTCCVLLIMQAYAAGVLGRLTQKPPTGLLLSLLALAFLITPAHTIGWQLGGVVRKTVETVGHFL